MSKQLIKKLITVTKLARKSQLNSYVIRIATSRVSHIINIKNIDIPLKRSPTLMWSPYVTILWGRIVYIISQSKGKINRKE